MLEGQEDEEEEDDDDMEASLSLAAMEAELKPQIAAVQAVINQPTPELQSAQENWEHRFQQKINWQTVLPSASRTESGAKFEIQEDESLFVTETDTNNESTFCS